MDQRPHLEETDDDLIKKNEEFLQKLKRKTKDNEDLIESNNQDEKRQKPTEHSEDFMHEPDNIIKRTRNPESLLTDIVEKNVDNNATEKEQSMVLSEITMKKGFPSAFVRDKTLLVKSKEGGSIFSRMQKKKSANPENVASTVANDEPKIQLNSRIISILGESEARKIDEENAEKISQMSETDIKKEINDLVHQLDPKLISILKSRKSGGTNVPIPTTSKTAKEEEKMEIDNSTRDKTKKVSNQFDVPKFNTDKEQNEEDEIAKESLHDLPIDTLEAKKWLHMDVVENEKLKWMTQLPKPKPITAGQSYSARFGFDGSLMPPQAEIDVRTALHHHGEEQARPGYTLEELLLFSRSSIPQQRVIGLTTIANILGLAKQGRLDLCLGDPILPQLLNAGIFAALRFSLDDSIPMVHEAAIQALTEIICSEPDEVCLRQLRGTSYGATLPSLECKLEEEGPKEKGQEALVEGELKDHELLQFDVVKGALRTRIIPRIRYLLEILKPRPKTVQCLLRVLTRLAMHSRDVSFEIATCPDLLKTIICNFIPSHWESTTINPSDVLNVYGIPQAKALSLLRVLASQSSSLASDLVHKYDIMKSLLAYIAAEPCETGIPDGSSVILESLYLWQTFITHGYALNYVEQFSDILTRLIGHHALQTNLGAPRFLLEHATALISIIQSLFMISPTHGDKLPKDFIISLSPVLLRATSRWLNEATNVSNLSFSDMKLIGAGLNVVSTGFKYALLWQEVDELSWLNQLENTLKFVVFPFLDSSILKSLTNNLLSNSSFLNSNTNSGKGRDPKGLPSLGACMWGQAVTPSIQATSPIPLLEPLSVFLVTASQIFPQHKQNLSSLLKLPGIRKYLETISIIGCPGSGNWFSRWEERFSCCLLELESLKTDPNDIKLVQCAALYLLPALTVTNLSSNLLSTCIFNQIAFQDDIAPALLGTLQLKEKSNLPSVVPNNIVSTDNDLLVQAYENLPLILNTYKKYPVFLQDWPFAPLVIAASDKENSNEKVVNSLEIEHCLQWILLLEMLRPQIIEKMLTPTGRYCRLSCLFLTGSDIFLEPKIHALAEAVLNKISINKLNFTEDIPGLKSFWELFVTLCDNYIGESYGDLLFANILLIPLQQTHDSVYRKYIWGEKAEILRFIKLEPNQLLIDFKNFLHPYEEDVSLLNCYLKFLVSGTLHGILAMIAVHHLLQYSRKDNNIPFVNNLKQLFNNPPTHIQSIIKSLELYT